MQTLGRQRLVKGGTELGVPIVRHVTARSGHVIDGIAGHVSDSGFGWVPGDTGDANAPGSQMKEEKNIVGREASLGEHLGGEEVCARRQPAGCG